MLDDVATPRSEISTAFWTAMTSTCMTNPIPRPSSTMYAITTTEPVAGLIVESRERATAVITVPMIGYRL